MRFSRRSFIQAVSVLAGSVGAFVRSPIKLEASVSAEAAESAPVATRLERFLKSHGIKPAHLARQSGFSRQFLLRLRWGRIEPSPTCIAALVCACRHLTREQVLADDLFSRDVIRNAFRTMKPGFLEPDEEVEMRAVFGRWRDHADV